MHNHLKIFILCCFFFCASIIANAQNKYAVLVAVNDYFDAPGVKSDHSLSGCINDAEAIKGLLINRFGFDQANIHTLYNAAATKKNFIDLLYDVMHACKPGDAFVFYYSGHGVWMTNHALDDNPVKRGMSQAIVMSDLYSPGWDCLIRDETMKNIFNQYVNKKIIVTTIFDCCFSGSILRQPKTKYWGPWLLAQKTQKKDLSIDAIDYIPRVKKPKGCSKVDSLGYCVDTLDTDHDGFPDCIDWEIDSPFNSSVDSLGIARRVDVDGFAEQPDYYFYDSSRFSNEMDEKNYNLKDALQVSNKSSKAPTDIADSKFFSFYAAKDNKKALEITDISEQRHGAFTAAILQVYRTKPPTIPVYELMNEIEAVMARQSYKQGPDFQYDPARMNNNLIGINSGFSERLNAICVSNKNGRITINKGLLAGVTKGNIFSDANLPGVQVQVSKVFKDSAQAIDKTNGKIKQGHIFRLTDDYTISNPLVKIFIPKASFTPTSFRSFLTNKIIPLTNRSDYADYDSSDEMQNATLMIWKNANSFQKISNAFYPEQQNSLLYVLLPVPSFVFDSVKHMIMKDQNIEIVDDPRKADFGAYLNYVKQRGSTPGKFVFYIHPIIDNKSSVPAEFFSEKPINVADLGAKNISQITQGLYKQIIELIRYKTNTWMNTYPRR